VELSQVRDRGNVYPCPMAKAKERKVPEFSKDQAVRLARVVNEASTNFKGQIDELEGAIGVLFVGHLFGRRVVTLIHNKRTLRKYEEILGISFRDEFEDVGPLASKSLGYVAVEKLQAFWKAVSGEVQVERRREIE
jgi:hypothetical protein